jgi:hypothetical protein
VLRAHHRRFQAGIVNRFGHRARTSFIIQTRRLRWRRRDVRATKRSGDIAWRHSNGNH